MHPSLLETTIPYTIADKVLIGNQRAFLYIYEGQVLKHIIWVLLTLPKGPVHETFDYKRNTRLVELPYFNKDQSLGIFLEIHVAGTKGGFCVQKNFAFLGKGLQSWMAAPMFEII